MTGRATQLMRLATSRFPMKSRRRANPQATGVDLMIGRAVRIGRPDPVGSLSLALQSKKARQEATAGHGEFRMNTAHIKPYGVGPQGIIDQLNAIASTTGPSGARRCVTVARGPDFKISRL
jgi:hypothetical protein